MRISDQVRISRFKLPTPDPIEVFGTPVTTATQGLAYAGFTVSAIGGVGVKTYSLAPGSGPLPAGITLDANSGVVAGTPTVTGSFLGIVIRATDSVSSFGDLAPFNLPVSPSGTVAVLFGNSSQNAAGAGLVATTTTQVNAAANQMLIAAVFNGGGVADDIVSVTATGYTGVPVAMTKAAGVKGNLGSRNHICEIWTLLNPTFGNQLITVTRATQNASRFYVAGSVAYDVDQAAGVVDSSAVFANAPGSASYSSPITTTQSGLMVISAFSGFETTSADTATPLSGQTAIQNIEPATDYYGGLSYRQAGSAGAFAMGATTNGGTWRSAIVVSIILKATGHVDVAPTFYVSPTGDDNADGLTTGTAIKTPARIEKLPKQPGKVIRVNGFSRNAAPPANFDDYAFSLVESGTALEPVKIEAYGSGPAAILGDVLYPTGWVAATQAETNTFYASIEKRDMGATMEWGNAPFCGGMMLMPAQWAKGVTLSGIHWWNDTAPGSKAFYHYTAAEFGGTSDPNKMVSYTDRGAGYSPADQRFLIQIKDPSIGTHYGANSPIGRGLAYRTGTGGNSSECVPISYYDQATGVLRGAGPGAPATDGYWAVRFHPVDLTQVGQYAYSQNIRDLFAAFPSGAERSVLRYNFGAKLVGDNIQVNGVGFGRACAKPNTQQYVLQCRGANGQVSDITVAQVGIMGSPDAIQVYGEVGAAPGYAFSGSTNWSFSNIRILEGWGTSGGFRIFGQDIDIDGLYIRDAGGTYVFFGGAATGVAANLDLCEQLGVHGNAGTSYQRSFNVTFTKFAAMGSISPITSQNNDDTLRVKGNQYTNGVITGMRSLTGGFDNLYALRLDGGDYGSLIDRVVTWNAPNLLTDNPAPNNASNNGMIFRRSAMTSLGVAAISCSGVTMQDLITTGSGGSSIAQWTSVGGATVAPARCSQVTETPTGAISDAAWEVMSRNAGGAMGYSAFQIGPDAWGWQIPAYGGARTMVPLKLTTPDQFSGVEQNKSFSSVYGAMPGSTLELLPGATDNNEFAIDRGVLRRTAGALTANKKITVREYNAAATNGPYRDTEIDITIRDPFATFG